MTEENIRLTGIIPDHTVDALNLKRPLPILRAKKALATIEKKKILKIIVSEPGAGNDFSSWCERAGYDYMGEKIEDTNFSHFISK